MLKGNVMPIGNKVLNLLLKRVFGGRELMSRVQTEPRL